MQYRWRGRRLEFSARAWMWSTKGPHKFSNTCVCPQGTDNHLWALFSVSGGAFLLVSKGTKRVLQRPVPPSSLVTLLLLSQPPSVLLPTPSQAWHTSVSVVSNQKQPDLFRGCRVNLKLSSCWKEKSKWSIELFSMLVSQFAKYLLAQIIVW